MAEKGLAVTHENFCVEYVKHGNATAAYRAAYPKSKASDKSINELASRMLADVKIQSRIESLRKAAQEKSELKAADILNEIRRLCAVDPRKLMHPDGRIKMPHELDEDTAAAIASFEVDIDGGIKYKFWDKNSALERASKILGLFEKDNKQKTDPLQALIQSLPGAVMSVAKVLNDDKGEEDE